GRSARFEMYRTMWENHALDGVGQSFYLHDGCEVNKPVNVEWAAYDDANYGWMQNAESLLFYANGLAVMSRAKVFYDTPNGFFERVATSGRFGDGLAGYVAVDAANAGLNPAGTSDPAQKRSRTLARKETYFWSMIGDFTLRIRY